MNLSAQRLALLAVRFALAAGFLSAVADRFGLWGPPGTAGVAWGAWAPFVDYTGKLNYFVPAALVPWLALLATAAEVVLALALIAGILLRTTALASAALLLSFALTMSFSGGIKGPLDYSVFTATAAALLLFANSPPDALSRRFLKPCGS